MSAFTKGPWEIGALDTFPGVINRPIYCDEGDVVCRVTAWENEPGEAEANAILIAAAPELFQTLKDVHGRILGLQKFGPMGTNDFPIILSVIEEAILKAKGE